MVVEEGSGNENDDDEGDEDGEAGVGSALKTNGEGLYRDSRGGKSGGGGLRASYHGIHRKCAY
jgi:hypothetical protein